MIVIQSNKANLKYLQFNIDLTKVLNTRLTVFGAFKSQIV